MKLSHQADLFDAVKAQQLRDKGVDLAMNADRIQIWKAKAEEWLNGVPSNGLRFTADSLTEAIGLPDEGPNQNNVVGAMFSSWAKKKQIRSTDYRTSSRTARHAGVLRVWEKC